MSGKFIILTFATEGLPHDGGTNLTAVEREFRNIVESHADKYLTFTPRTLAPIDPSFNQSIRDYTTWLEQHPDRRQLGKHNPGWASIGFQMWKPFLMEHVLTSDATRPGDIVLYHDINFHKYPNYVLNCDQWRDLSLKVLTDLGCDIFIPSSGDKLKKDVKAYLIRKYLGEEYFEKTGLWVGLIIIRKSAQSLRFLNEWKEMSAQLDNISFLPNPDPHPDMIWHSPEQAVAAVLGYMWRSQGLLPKSWPYYEVKHRIFSEEYLWRTDSWNLGKRARRLISKLRKSVKRIVG